MWAFVMAIVGRISTTSMVSPIPPGKRRGRTISLLNGVLEQPWGEMAERVHGHDLLGITPLGKWPNCDGGLRVGEVWSIRELVV